MAKVRVHELAKEFGVESKDILAKLKQLGVFVKSASSTVQPHVVKQLTDEYGDELRTMPYTPAIEPGACAVGAVGESSALRRRPPSSVRRDRPRRTTWDDSPFDQAGERLWRRYGLGDFDAPLALFLLEHGVLPEDLQVRLDGVRAVVRLKGGLEPRTVVVRDILEARRRAS